MTQHEPASAVGSLADKEATSDSKLHMPEWMMIAGAVIGIVGAIIMAVARGNLRKAKAVDAYQVGYGWPSGSPQIDGAIAWGHFGLGALITGLALALAGLVVVALRR